MKFWSGKRQSGINTQILQWQICDDERAWEQTQRQSNAALAAEMPRQSRTPRHWRRWGATLACLLIGLAVLGGWAWQRAQAGLAALERELEAEIVADLYQSRPPKTTFAASEGQTLPPLHMPHEPGKVVTQVKIRDLGHDWVVSEVTIQPTRGGPSYRQTRIYYETGRGWRRGEVSASRWGAARRLESAHFILHYRTLDEDAVMQVAPQLDTLYLALSDTIFARWRMHKKLTIKIDPEYVYATLYLETWQNWQETELVIASPSAMLAPADLATHDLLLQTLTLALYDRFATAAPTKANLASRSIHLHNALRLWFIWQHELPLAKWRQPLVTWILEPQAKGARQNALGAPDFAGALCTHHTLWMRTPLSLSVPILCWQSNAGEDKIIAWRYHYTVDNLSPQDLLYVPATNLEQPNVSQDLYPPTPGPSVILLATLFEYVSSTYGTEQIPSLLAALPKHTQAETLIPAVFGDSLGDFEQGWRDFVMKEYEIIQ